MRVWKVQSGVGLAWADRTGMGDTIKASKDDNKERPGMTGVRALMILVDTRTDSHMYLGENLALLLPCFVISGHVQDILFQRKNVARLGKGRG